MAPASLGEVQGVLQAVVSRLNRPDRLSAVPYHALHPVSEVSLVIERLGEAGISAVLIGAGLDAFESLSARESCEVREFRRLEVGHVASQVGSSHIASAARERNDAD